MTRAVKALALGLFILFLSRIMWETTGSFVGWLALFLPGSVYVFRGCFWAIGDD